VFPICRALDVDFGLRANGDDGGTLRTLRRVFTHTPPSGLFAGLLCASPWLRWASHSHISCRSPA
jgi:hypothetical protein